MTTSARPFTVETLPGVADVVTVHGASAREQVAPRLLVEVPHGATQRAHFDALRAQLKGKDYPADLVDFFFVNTDVGAPEAALALAQAVTRLAPEVSARIVRCHIPRTFIDCNRAIDASTRPTTSTATGMTPGVVRYVTDAEDLALLFAKYAAYRGLVEREMDEVLGKGGTAVMLHTYAPRSVDVPVDENIVQALHAAYAPDKVDTWPLRAEVDLITTTPEGTSFADEALVQSVRDAFAEGGVQVARGEAYPMHPSTLAYAFADKWRGQTLCLELRRDLLVKAFTPFAEMQADNEKAARMGGLLADGVVRWWRARA